MSLYHINQIEAKSSGTRLFPVSVNNSHLLIPSSVNDVSTVTAYSDIIKKQRHSGCLPSALTRFASAFCSPFIEIDSYSVLYNFTVKKSF